MIVCDFCRVRLVERGAPQSLPLMESGKVRCVQIQLMNQEVKVEYMFTVSFLISRYCQVLG